MNYKGIFLQFLTKIGVAGKVYDNCGRPILGELDAEDPEDYLLSLFLFSDTREGTRFWVNVQEGWLDYLDKVRDGGEVQE